MFNKLLAFLLSFLMGLIFLLFVGCGDDNPINPDNTTIPVLITSAVSAITQTAAECGGNITSDGGAAVTARGVCWSTNETPTIADNTTTDGTGTGSFISTITGLTGITPYSVRAYATNSAGTAYGNILSFTTTDSMGTVTDIDGNSYLTVKVGNQWWMAENLKVTHYCNGDTIPNITDSTAWENLTSDAYCEYNNDTVQVAVYGRLYNWYTVDDNRGVAPAGWHVPSDTEWQTLVDYLGGDTMAGGKMKETGTTHWLSPNTGSNNESGFTALPGGCRYDDGSFAFLGVSTYFWSSTESISGTAWSILLGYNYADVSRYYVDKLFGFSVRCVRD